jgi:hypothetical protein
MKDGKVIASWDIDSIAAMSRASFRFYAEVERPLPPSIYRTIELNDAAHAKAGRFRDRTCGCVDATIVYALYGLMDNDNAPMRYMFTWERKSPNGSLHLRHGIGSTGLYTFSCSDPAGAKATTVGHRHTLSIRTG